MIFLEVCRGFKLSFSQSAAPECLPPPTLSAFQLSPRNISRRVRYVPSTSLLAPTASPWGSSCPEVQRQSHPVSLSGHSSAHISYLRLSSRHPYETTAPSISLAFPRSCSCCQSVALPTSSQPPLPSNGCSPA